MAKKDEIIHKSGRARSHQKYIDSQGRQQPGGSTIANLVQFSGADGLIFWGIKLYKEGQDFKQFREESAQFGNAAHRAVECLFKGERFDEENYPGAYVEPAKKMAENFFKTLGNLGMEMVGSEVSLACSHPDFPDELGALDGLWGGQLDLILKTKDSPVPNVLGDLKTSSSFQPSHIIQTAGCYDPIFEAKYGQAPDSIWLFRLDRNAPHSCIPHEIETEKRAAAKRIALNARAIYEDKSVLTRGLR